MPIYTYRCDKCNNQIDEYRKVADYDKPKPCPCGGTLQLAIVPTARPVNIYPFVDEYMDSKPIVIHSLSHYRKELKKRGLQEVGAGKGNKGQWV